MSKERIDVFISSTSIDLPKYREAVRDAILSLGFFPNGMEHWPVTGENPVDLCKRMVEESEIYIGIFAHRFGWKPDGYGGKSITELEYDWAADVTYRGEPIPRLCFVIKREFPWPPTDVEDDAKEDLLRFKGRVKSNQVGFFTTPEDLKAQVVVALSAVKEKWRKQDDTFRWQPGNVLQERYTLRMIIGSGGNGDVWQADEALPDDSTRPVAIKVLRPGISNDPVRVQRFRAEISVMARIMHDHIVPIYTYGERDKQQYVVMPFMPGGTFRAKLTDQPLSLDEALPWLEQIGAALDHVHDRHHGIIHRDVKPENMLLSEDEDRLYLADFGLVFSSDRDERISEDGKRVGTGRYMAPEQWRNKPISRQTDLYALGILAYELLTGHLPFQYENDLDLGNAHCEQDLPADPALPDEILRILHRATAKNPADRYPTARAFLMDLRNWDEDPANLDPRIRDYLKWVTDEMYENLRQLFIELAGDRQTMLGHTPTTKTKLPVWADDEDDLFARATATVHADHVPATPDESRVQQQFVENVRQRLLGLERAVLVGEPGSGKSWMLRRLQADYARSWLKGMAEGRGLVPVLVRLNEYTGGPFIDFVKAEMDMLAPYHDTLLRDGRLVLLCDALNEMPRADGQMRKLIAYLKDAPYFIVSCRVRDYRDDLGELKPLEQVLLRDLELPAIRELVHKRLPDEQGPQLWQEMGGTAELFKFWEQVNEKGEGERFWNPNAGIPSYTDVAGDNDWRAIHTGARLIPLARNPYMGDLLCKTYRQSESGLPDSRAALFGQFINQMLTREAKAAARRGDVFPDPIAIQDALVKLARALQASERTTITPDDAVKALTAEALSPESAGAGTTAATPEQLLRAATDANILNNDGEVLRFSHQLLQEYFAARILLEQMEADEHENTHRRAIALLGSDWWDAGVWRETTVILGEFLGDGARGPNRVARWLAPASPEVALQVITRNAAGLTVDNVEDSTREAFMAVTLPGERGDLQNTNIDPRGRASVYRALGLISLDQRPGVSVIVRDGVTLPGIDWVEIPAGTFLYGDDKTEKHLDTFWIARYPITNAQFQCFLNDEQGYNNREWWTQAGWEWKGERTAPDEYSDPDFRLPNHPRIYVRWYEAIAFAHWLGARLGMTISLPTEEQWEKAARGTDGRKYPWGDEWNADKCNNDVGQRSIDQTSAVGLYLNGQSPYAVLDMSGNVWEWCRTDYESGSNEIEGGNMRVLRGGSWSYFYSVSFRCADRGGNNPGDGGGIRGFRVSRS